MSEPDDREPWRIELTPLVGEDWRGVPVGARMRRGLKYLLRACGLRCTRLLQAEDLADSSAATSPKVKSDRPQAGRQPPSPN